jgi:hypothetical protein
MENMSLQSEPVAQTKRPPRSAVDAFEASLGPRKTYTKVVSKPETPAKATLSVSAPPPPPPPLATPPPPALPSLPNQRLSTPPAIPNSPRPPKNDKKVTVLNPIYAGIECAACNRAIDGHEVVHAADKTFHSGCFTCSKCGQSLADKHFYEKNNQILCERDYKDAFSMHCDFCGEFIENVRS